MKLFLIAFLMLISCCLFAQDKDLIVDIKMDSTYCSFVKEDAGIIHYTVNDSLYKRPVSEVFYVMRQNKNRPNYYNTDFDINTAMADKGTIPGPVRTEIPVFKSEADAQRQIEQLHPWRAKAGRRLRTAGVFTIVGAAAIVASGIVAQNDPQVGALFLSGGAIMQIASTGFIISAGTHMMGYHD